jgi:hypothetical protein
MAHGAQRDLATAVLTLPIVTELALNLASL